MGKKTGIILSFVLSLMFVYTSAGIAIQKCCCHDKIMASMMRDDCCGSGSNGAGSKGCDVKKQCMTLTVIKLSPTVAAQKSATVMPCVHAALLPDLFSGLNRLLPCDNTSFTLCQNGRRHAPPREYLTLLRVLRL